MIPDNPGVVILCRDPVPEKLRAAAAAADEAMRHAGKPMDAVRDYQDATKTFAIEYAAMVGRELPLDMKLKLVMAGAAAMAFEHNGGADPTVAQFVELLTGCGEETLFDFTDALTRYMCALGENENRPQIDLSEFGANVVPLKRRTRKPANFKRET